MESLSDSDGTGVILALNIGSIDLKFGAFECVAGGGLRQLTHGVVRAGEDGPPLQLWDGQGMPIEGSALFTSAVNRDDAVSRALEWLHQKAPTSPLVGIGHRFVGGEGDLRRPVLVTHDVLRKLQRHITVDPMRTARNLGGVRRILRAHPEIPQVICFDNAFHSIRSRVAQAYEVPRNSAHEGMGCADPRGLAFDYIAGVLPEYLRERAHGRVVVVHIGRFASMCALNNGQSVATTMGAASASLDPPVSASIEFYVYSIVRELGGLVAVLGGLEALVFTADVGEHHSMIRRRVCQSMAWLGVDLDELANRRHARRISRSGSKVSVLVIPSNEELVIARDTRAMLRVVNPVAMNLA